MADGTLIITNGTKRVNMLGGRATKSGIYLDTWKPSRLPIKGGGIWHDSVISDFRTSDDHRWGNITETFYYKIAGQCTDDVVYYSQEFDRLLIQAIEYWELKQSRFPVWIEKRGSNESNTSYAIVYGFHLPDDNNPFSEPFWNFIKSTQDKMTIGIQHGPWLDSMPGQYNDTPAGAVLCNNYISNPSFEDWNPAPPPVLPTPWVSRSSPTLIIENEDPAYIRTGTKSAGMNNTAGLDRGLAYVLSANETVFLISVDVYVVSGQAFLAAYDPAQSQRSGGWAVTGGTGWQTLSFIHVGYGAGGPNTEIRIGTTAEAGGEVYFDDISACCYYGNSNWLVESAVPGASGDDATISGSATITPVFVWGAANKIQANNDMSSPTGWNAGSAPQGVAVLSPSKVVLGHVADAVPGNYQTQACVADIVGGVITPGAWYNLDNLYANANTPKTSSLIEINPTTILYSWLQYPNASPTRLRSVAATVAGTVLSVGTQAGPTPEFTSTNFRDCKSCRLTDTKAVVISAKNNSSGTAWVVSVVGNAATYGAGVEFATIGTECAVSAMSDTKFAVFYTQSGDCYVKIGTVSGTTITFGAAYQVTVDLANLNDDLALTALSNSLLVFAWQETDTSPYNRYKYLRAGTVSGTVVALGGTVTVGTTAYGYYSSWNSLDKVNSSTFIYRYDIDGIGADSGDLRIGTVAGATITMGPYLIDPTGNYTDAQVRWLGKDRAIVYSADESITHTMYAAVVSGFGIDWIVVDSFGSLNTIGTNDNGNLASRGSVSDTQRAIAVLSESKVVLMSIDRDAGGIGEGQMRAWIADISGDIITEGSKYNIGAQKSYQPEEFSVQEVDSDTFICAWLDAVSSSAFKCLIQAGNVAGTTISLGNTLDWESQFGTAGDRTENWYDVDVCAMTDTLAVVAHGAGGSDYNVYVALVSISGNTLSWLSPEYNPSSYSLLGLDIIRLTNTKFVLSFSESATPPTIHPLIGHAMIGDISGGTISFGSKYEFYFNPTAQLVAVSGCRLTDSKFVLTWQEGYGVMYSRVGVVTGNTIAWGTVQTVFAAYIQPGCITVDRMDDDHFLVSYMNQDAVIDTEYFNIGTVVGTEIEFGAGPWDNSSSPGSLYSASRVLSASKAIAFRIEDGASPWYAAYAKAYTVNILSSGGSSGFSWSAIDLVGTSLTVGELPPDTAYAFGVRFKDVDVPAGATIVSAFIRFNNVVATNIGVMAQIYGEYSASPAIFTTVGDFIGRTLTPTFVPWQPAIDYANNQAIETPDIKSIIGQVIGLPDWNSGDDLAIIIYDPFLTTGKTIAVSSIDSAQPEPELFIIYGLDS